MSLLRIKQADGTWSNIPAIKGADGVDGKDGAVQYTAGRYIQIDEDTQTINCTVKIGDLVIIDAVPVKDSTNVVSSGGVYDALEAKADKTEIAGLGGEAGFITNSVEDLKNYYKKSETYSQEEVNSLLGNLTRLTLEVVQELPEVGTEHIIYLVPNNESGNNVYEEWIFIQSKWEMIGTTEVDLGNYYTKEEIDALLALNDSQAQLHIYPIEYEFATNSTPQWLNYPDTTSSATLNKINELYKKGIYKFTIRYTNPGKAFHLDMGIIIDPSKHTITRVGSSGVINSGGNGTPHKTIKLQVGYGSYTYDSTTDTFGFNGSNFAALFISDPPTYVNSSDVLTKGNTTAFTPSANYHPATKKYVDDKVLEAIPQKREMPEASADYIDKVYQYIGEDTGEFTKGFFYQCIETQEGDTTVYSWSELKFNTSSSDSEGDTIIVKLEGYFNTLSYNIDREKISGVTLTANDRLTLTDIVNKYYTGYEFTKEIILKTSEEVYYIHGWGNGTASGGRTTLHLYLYPVSSTDSNLNKTPLVINTLSMCFEGSLGTYTPYYSSGLSYWWTDTYCIPYLHKENKIPYTPSSDYNPATKKYVDDAVANAGGGSGGEGTDLSNYYTKEEIDALIPEKDELARIPYIMVSYSLNNSDSIRELGKLFTNHYKKYNNINTLVFGMVDFNASYTKIFRWKNNGTGEGGRPTEVTFICFDIYSSNIGSMGIAEYKWRFSFDADGNISVGSPTITSIDYISRSFLAKDNAISFTPTGDYNPATKKYVDDAVANAGGGETPDLTAYAKLTDVLSKTNTTEYTPASAYHPATKQYVDQTVSSMGGITEESDPTVPLHVKNITQDMISKWNTVEDKLTKEELSTSASEAGLVTIDSINYPIVIKGRYNVDVVKYSGNETVTPQILDYTIDESAMPFINAALKRFLKIKQDTGQSLIYTDSSFGDYIMVYMPLDISLLVELLKDATIEYNDYDDANNSYTKTTAINSDDIKAFTPSIANNLDGHRAVLSVMHYFNEQYQSFDDIKITFKEIYSDYNRKDISLRISSKINYNSEYDFELHTLSLSQNTALHTDKGTGTVIPTSTNDLNNNSGFITSDDLPEQLVIEGVIDETYGKGNRILNPGKGSYSSINKPNENAFAIGEFSTSAGFNTVAYGSGALAEGYNINSRIMCSSGQSSGKEVTFEGVGNSSHIRVGSKIYNDKLKKAFTVTEVTEYESGEITYRNIKIKRDSQDEDVFSGNNYIINAGSIATHSEGMECQALGNCSHAEGSRAVATGYASHAQNDATTSNGIYSHAGGLWSEANAECSIAHGRTLTNNVAFSALFGKYATLDAEADADVVFAIGNGNSYDDQNIGLKLVGAKGEGKLYVENTLMGADPSTYAGFDNTKTQVLKHINGVFTWVDE